MPEIKWVSEVRAWLQSLPGDDLLAELDADWNAFAQNNRAVLTLFGSYDTGKSALLRRLLVDEGKEVPEWVTISARHETFEVNEIELAGCAIRDTPGIVVGASDVRGEHNTAQAELAIALTDVAIITVPPQLPTAERDKLLGILGQGWRAGALWFVITKFDEAGIDPIGDANGYNDLAARKSVELSQSLGLEEGTPIFVTVADYAQLAGPERNPDPGMWDMSREWDGVAELLAAIRAAADSPLEELRPDAEARYWRVTATSTLNELESHLRTLRIDLSLAEEGCARRMSWLDQLDALDKAAHAALSGTVEEAIRSAINSQSASAQELVSSVGKSLDNWAGEQEQQLEVLRQDVAEVSSTQRERPSWRSLDELLRRLDSLSQPSESSLEQSGDELPVSKIVSKLSLSLTQALAQYDATIAQRTRAGADRASKTSSTSDKAKAVAHKGGESADRFRKGLDVLSASAPVVIEAAAVVESEVQRRAAEAERRRRRDEMNEMITDIAAEASASAYQEWRPLVEELRLLIRDATAAQAELAPGLRELLLTVETAIERGSRLVAAGTSGQLI